MPSHGPSRIIVDTNIWISFLIGQELQNLKDLLVGERVKLVISDQLVTEIRTVTSREKLKKYFEPEKIEDLLTLIDLISEKVRIKKIDRVCRDPKDDFLLALAKQSKADYLVTGDKDLLEMKEFGGTKIVTAKQFAKRLG